MYAAGTTLNLELNLSTVWEYWVGVGVWGATTHPFIHPFSMKTNDLSCDEVRVDAKAFCWDKIFKTRVIFQYKHDWSI